ncbi:hypothetical protein HY571_01330, partial [Candidatus Micrarchaeota archaeon]|nr:hypothetical protein [Candidatus Micrarchaeota archaeon]
MGRVERMTRVFEQPTKIRRRGRLKFFKTKSGSHVIILPTCTVPPHVLIENNWHLALNKSSTRVIRGIDMLHDGSDVTDLAGKRTTLWAKQPEIRFYRQKDGGPWLFGTVQGDKIVTVSQDVRVQKQATWEARILLSLLKRGKRAEIPQALVIHPNGIREVITKGIQEPRFGSRNDFNPDKVIR